MHCQWTTNQFQLHHLSIVRSFGSSTVLGNLRFFRENRIRGGVVVRKEYGQKCELGTKNVPCAIIYTGANNSNEMLFRSLEYI